eukprot:gene2378-8685_t
MQLRAFSTVGATPRASRAQRVTRPRNVAVLAAEQDSGGDFMNKVKMLAKKLQGALPIVGLVSRLTSPEGGFDDLSYPEFARSSRETANDTFRFAMADLEVAHGKIASSRWVLLVLWMTKQGVGIIAAKDIINACRRMRVTQDIEIELDRFEGGKLVAKEKYEMIAYPDGALIDKVTVAIDALCVLCIGLKDGVTIAESDQPVMIVLVCETFPGATPEMVQRVINERPSRASNYLNVR